MEKEEAKLEFLREFGRIVPSFQLHLEEQAAAQQERSALTLAAQQENKIQEEKDRETQMEKQSEEMQRRSIQVLLTGLISVVNP
jgi:hypothetical protein